MTYPYSKYSLERIYSCVKPLQIFAFELAEYIDCRALYGHRAKTEQDRLYTLKRSKVQWPDSKHNKSPSEALDIVPYPVIWPNKKDSLEKYSLDLGALYMFVGFMKGIAVKLNMTLRFGADWDSDFQISDQTFHDLPHVEWINP